MATAIVEWEETRTNFRRLRGLMEAVAGRSENEFPQTKVREEACRLQQDAYGLICADAEKNGIHESSETETRDLSRIL